MGIQAIVLGSTGLVGSSLIKQLCDAPAIGSVVAISRRTFGFDHPKLTTHIVDFERLDQHTEAFKGDVLFSCLGTTKKQAGSIAAQRIVDVDYQFQAAQLAKQQGVQHLSLVSSSGASEGSLFPYLHMKGELENKIKALGFARFSVFQPSVLLGERDYGRFAEEISGVVLPWLCRLPGLRQFRPIQGAQVALRMLQVATEAGQGITFYRLADVFPQNEPAA